MVQPEGVLDDAQRETVALGLAFSHERSVNLPEPLHSSVSGSLGDRYSHEAAPGMRPVVVRIVLRQIVDAGLTDLDGRGGRAAPVRVRKNPQGNVREASANGSRGNTDRRLIHRSGRRCLGVLPTLALPGE